MVTISAVSSEKMHLTVTIVVYSPSKMHSIYLLPGPFARGIHGAKYLSHLL